MPGFLLILEGPAGVEDTDHCGAGVAGAEAEKGNELQAIWFLRSLKGSKRLPRGTENKSVLRNSPLKSLGLETRR